MVAETTAWLDRAGCLSFQLYHGLKEIFLYLTFDGIYGRVGLSAR